MGKHRVRKEGRRGFFGSRARDDLFERSFRSCRRCGQDVYVLADDCRDCGQSLDLAGRLF
jgi:ribosomal protein L40E